MTTDHTREAVAKAIVDHAPEVGHREAYCDCGLPIGDYGTDWPDHIASVITTHVAAVVEGERAEIDRLRSSRAQAEWDRAGGVMWFDRDQWGVVVDGLMGQRQDAMARKNVNPDSNSDLRAERCAEMIRQIATASQLTAGHSNE